MYNMPNSQKALSIRNLTWLVWCLIYLAFPSLVKCTGKALTAVHSVISMISYKHENMVRHVVKIL